MSRSIPPDRFRQLVEAATKTFIARGYRLTQVADVAEALGVAKGTLYGYVESKEALFDVAVRYADGLQALPELSELPLPTPPPGATVAHIRARLADETRDLVLAQVVAQRQTFRHVGDEVEAVLSDLYRRLERNRRTLKLIDRCAADYPELAAAWFGDGRFAQHQLLVTWLRGRASSKRFHRVTHPELVARLVLETIAYWAMHRHFDPAPQPMDDATAERMVIETLTRALLVTP